MELKSAAFNGSGGIAFTKRVDPRPGTEETKGNVTIVNQAQPGEPSHFVASFRIEATFEVEGLQTTNVLLWDVVIPEDDQFAPYRSVEDRAAKLIAPMLRSVADKLEADLPDFSARTE